MDNIKKTELNHLQADLADEMSHYTQYKALLGLAMVVTLISYLFFSGHLKLGNPLYWGEYFSKGTATTAAFFFMFASVILLGVFLAWVKHFAYSHFTTYRAIAGVMVTLVGFALMAEMFAALEDQKAKADIQLEGNAAYKATIQPTISSISYSPSLAGEIAAASQNLARCQQNIGKPGYKHCEGDKARLAALEKQQSAALGAQVAASAETEKLRYERQDKMKADAHNDFIVGLAQFYSSVAYAFSGEQKPDNAYIDYISWGNITLMLIIAIAFERLHAFLIEAGRDIKGNIRGIEQRIAQLQQGSINYAGLSHLPPVGSPLFKYQDEPKDGGFKSTGIGFTAPVGKPATAKSGFVGFKDTNGIKPAPAPEKPEIVESSGFRQSPEQRVMVDKLHHEQMKTYREELRGGSQHFRDVPLDRPAPANQKPAEEHYPLPIAEPTDTTDTHQETPNGHPGKSGTDTHYTDTPASVRVHPPEVSAYTQNGGIDASLLEALKGAKAHLPADMLKDASGLYQVWRDKVKVREIAPSVRPGKRFISEHLCRGGKKRTPTPQGMEALLSVWQIMAVREGILCLNPKQGRGLDKYILAA